MPAFMYSAVWTIWKARYLILAPQARIFFLKWSKIFNFITMKTDQERKKPKKAKKPFGMQIFRKKATGLQKKPKTGFLAWKKATWQPWICLKRKPPKPLSSPAKSNAFGRNPFQFLFTSPLGIPYQDESEGRKYEWNGEKYLLFSHSKKQNYIWHL